MKTTRDVRRPLAWLAGMMTFITSLAAGPAGAQDTAFDLSVSVNYSTGEYGTGQDVDIWSVPISGSLQTGPWNFGLTVPYIAITSAGDVVGGTDSPVVTKKKKTKTTGGVVDRTTESGLGDIVASLGYAALPGGENSPFVEIIGKVKFPTASESKSLGTGEFDYTAQVDFSQSFGRFTPFGTLGYRINGDPEDVELDNIFIASVGAVQAVSDHLNIGAALDYRQATTAGADDALELAPFVGWKFGEHAQLDFQGLLGLSDGSPDYGGSLQFTLKF